MLKWIIQHGVVIIPKSSNRKRLAENINLFDFMIEEKDMNELDGYNENLRLCKPDFMKLDF